LWPFLHERLRDRLFGEWRHHRIAGVIGQQPVTGQRHAEISSVRQRRVVVQVHRAALRRVVPNPAVQADDLSLRTNGRLLLEAVAHRRDRREDHANAVRLRQLGHRRDAVADGAFGAWPEHAGQVVGPAVNDDDARLERNHVLSKSHQHLRRRLADDAAIHVRLAAEELRARLAPQLGDLVAEKDHALFAWSGRRQLAVLAAVPGQPGPIAEDVAIPGELLLEGGGRRPIRRRLRGPGPREREQTEETGGADPSHETDTLVSRGWKRVKPFHAGRRRLTR
jgi:hypothetical protein